MSHIVKSSLKLVDAKMVEQAAKHNGFEIVGVGTHKLYNNQSATGLGIKLPDWNYPVVIDAEGTAHYDNYGGSWGKQIELDKLCQRYAIEVANYQAELEGYIVTEQQLENGDVELEIHQLVGN